MSDPIPDFGAGRAPRFALHRVGRIVFQRWYAAPELGDAMHVIQWVGAERRVVGADLAIVEVVGANAARPSREVVAETISVVRRYKFIRRDHIVVLEGDSLERRLVRGVFATITFLLGETLETAANVEEAIAHACAAIGQDVADTVASLEKLRVLHAH